MSAIKILVSCHRPYPVPKHPLLLPVQVGSALSDKRFPGFLYDDSGENISHKNPCYCEMTAQYWAWKNIQAGHIGFFHYRRYLYPDPNAKQVYSVRRLPSLPVLEKLGYADFPQKIERYDMVLPKGENMYVPVEQHYADSPWHHHRDLVVARQIIRERYPKMTWAAEEYLSNTICYFGNIYIMRWEIFCEYCDWVFSVLDEFDQRLGSCRYFGQARRVDGYLAERLLGIYYFYHRHSLKTLELPRVHFYDGRAYVQHCVQNMLLPPGSRRRSVVKQWRNRISATA